MKFIKSISSYEPKNYINIGIDQLVVYATKKIMDGGEECTFERLVYECFTLFPEKFKFKRYPQWPDSARINKAWLRCRTDKGWLAGTVKEGFRVTPSGETIARQTEKYLKGMVGKKILIPKGTRERYEAVLNYIKKSPEFTKFIEQENNDISISDLKSFLGGTLETPKRILIHNLNHYFQAATVYDDKSVVSFLKLCKEKLKHIGG